MEEGDWSGPGGAARVLAQPGIELAVLETARGGILRRGVGVAHNDVAVVTNISADHLGLGGIQTLDQLAEVKATIVRITRSGGWVVLNADDPRTLAMRRLSRARPFTFGLDPDAPGLREAQTEGGRAATVLDGDLVVLTRGRVDRLLPVLDVPVTLAGLASFNVANALAAAAAGIAVGLPREAVLDGLRGFRPDPGQNPGRMNILDLDGRAVIVDMAHNEASLLALLEVARGLRLPGGRVLRPGRHRRGPLRRADPLPGRAGGQGRRPGRDRREAPLPARPGGRPSWSGCCARARPRSGSPTCPPTRASWPGSRPWSPPRARATSWP